MGIIDDLRNEIIGYVDDEERFEIKIENFTYSGPHLSETNERFNFMLKVYNKGPLDMKNVKMRIEAVEGHVRIGIGPAEASYQYAYVTRAFNLDAYQHQYILFFGVAVKATIKEGSRATEKQDIMKVKVHSWDASLAYILNDCSSSSHAIPYAEEIT